VIEPEIKLVFFTLFVLMVHVGLGVRLTEIRGLRSQDPRVTALAGAGGGVPVEG